MRKWGTGIAVLSIMVAALGPTTYSHAQSKQPAAQKLNVHNLAVDEFFEQQEGTFILRDLKHDETFIYNRERANQQQTPESTFKIANALIGLQTGAVRDEYDVKRWDGVKRPFESWNRDHTLGSAMRESAIWYYQVMARDIGETRMKAGLAQLHYGNQDISGGIDQFWLDSSLTISPLEQADFLEKLYEEKLSVDVGHMKTVKRMMLQDEGDTYALYGKTGTRLSDMGLGWYVGFVRTGKRAYVFVTNVKGSGTQARAITQEILRKYALLPSAAAGQ